MKAMAHGEPYHFNIKSIYKDQKIFMDILNLFTDINNSTGTYNINDSIGTYINICNSIADIHNWIIEISKSFTDIHNEF